MCCTRRGEKRCCPPRPVSCLPPASVCLEVPLDTRARFTFQTTVFFMVATHLVLCAPQRGTTVPPVLTDGFRTGSSLAALVVWSSFGGGKQLLQHPRAFCKAAAEICLELPLGVHLRTLLLDRPPNGVQRQPGPWFLCIACSVSRSHTKSLRDALSRPPETVSSHC